MFSYANRVSYQISQWNVGKYLKLHIFIHIVSKSHMTIELYVTLRTEIKTIEGYFNSYKI